MNKPLTLLVIAIIAILLVSGCTSNEPEEATPTEGSEATPTITEEEKQTEILATAVTGTVMTMPGNWDADAEDDGIVIYPDLKDSAGETVKFEIELPVDIKIYTVKYVDFTQVEDRLVYSGTGTIDSWEDGNLFMGGGIRVSFEDIKTVASDEDYGIVYATTTLPDGRTIEAKTGFFSRIKPEE